MAVKKGGEPAKKPPHLERGRSKICQNASKELQEAKLLGGSQNRVRKTILQAFFEDKDLSQLSHCARPHQITVRYTLVE